MVRFGCHLSANIFKCATAFINAHEQRCYSCFAIIHLLTFRVRVFVASPLLHLHSLSMFIYRKISAHTPFLTSVATEMLKKTIYDKFFCSPLFCLAPTFATRYNNFPNILISWLLWMVIPPACESEWEVEAEHSTIVRRRCDWTARSVRTAHITLLVYIQNDDMQHKWRRKIKLCVAFVRFILITHAEAGT